MQDRLSSDVGFRYLLISPCRDEAKHMRYTLDSVANQTVLPALWVIVDDGSSDETPRILEEYAARYDWIRPITRIDRGRRAVGPGVIEAFYAGLETEDITQYDFLCKLDLDLDLPPGYFSELMHRMNREPRIGTCSGKPYFRTPAGDLVSEKCGDEMSVGMTKFYRTRCFQQIGGFARAVMWDAIDCHKARQLGWIACSWDAPGLRFEHLRPMGSSDKGILSGRMRHGAGQYYMGSDPLYFFATVAYRMSRRPYLVGGAAMLYGFLRAWITRQPRHEDRSLQDFIRRYQRRALTSGKRQAVKKIEKDRADLWSEDEVSK